MNALNARPKSDGARVRSYRLHEAFTQGGGSTYLLFASLEIALRILSPWRAEPINVGLCVAAGIGFIVVLCIGPKETPRARRAFARRARPHRRDRTLSWEHFESRVAFSPARWTPRAELAQVRLDRAVMLSGVFGGGVGVWWAALATRLGDLGDWAASFAFSSGVDPGVDALGVALSFEIACLLVVGLVGLVGLSWARRRAG